MFDSSIILFCMGKHKTQVWLIDCGRDEAGRQTDETDDTDSQSEVNRGKTSKADSHTDRQAKDRLTDMRQGRQADRQQGAVRQRARQASRQADEK